MDERSNVPALLGRAVRNRRHQLGFSQEELAWRAGLNRTYVTDVERGVRNLSLTTIERLAGALEISLSALLRDVDRARGMVEDAASVDILFVEDNRRDIELTLRALRAARVANSVHVARDGIEALDYLFCKGQYSDRKVDDHPHLVLLDLKLPGVDGLEVLRQMRSHERLRPVPVVVLTSSDESADIFEARALGAQAYIVKPVDFQRLSQVTPALDFSWTLLRRTGRPSERHSESVDS